MKPVFAALAIFVVAFPAASQTNSAPTGQYAAPAPAYTPAPLSGIAQQAYDACPALMARTDSAVANGHQQYYYASDCQCIAESIDYNTWDEASASYSGPLMSESDAYLILGAIAGAPTIDDAFTLISEGLTETGYSAMSACYAK